MMSLPPKVQKTIFSYKSDIRKSQYDSRPCCGTLHAFRTSLTGPAGGREEQCFVWVANYDTIEHASSHLEQFGFTHDKSQFIPYTSKSNWINKYPHAFPYVDCDVLGNVTGFPHWSPHAQSALDIPPEIASVAIQPSMHTALNRGGIIGSSNVALLSAVANSSSSSSKKKAGGSYNSLPNSVLANNERAALHTEIYNYFNWLCNQVSQLETTEGGRRSAKKADLTAASLKGLLIKMESTFKNVGKGKGTYAAGRMVRDGESMNVDDDDAQPAAVGQAKSPPIPLLEEALVPQMSTLAANTEDAQRQLKLKIKREASDRKKVAHWEPLDFEVMFAKLLAYKEEHGQPNVPVKYQKDVQLGGWVSGLRTKKKQYDKDLGVAAMDLDEEAAWTLPGGGVDGKLPARDNAAAAADASIANNQGTPGVGSQKYLTHDRIQRLNSIGFAWSMAKPKAKPKSWEERLEELRNHHAEHGVWKVQRALPLGEWLHNQRTLYAKKDTKFMQRKSHRMEEIGYTFDMRDFQSVSWDERYQQLVEYHNTHGSFDVPSPISETVAANGTASPEDMDRYRFHKWVARLHNEYRAFEKGTQSKLNAQRVEKLRSINFQFKGPSRRGRSTSNTTNNDTPIAWEKRISQLENFKKDTGHLNVDHNYKHCSNLGPWAAEMSTVYKDWKSGAKQLSQDMIDKLDELEGIGFKFDVLPYYENNRNWEDHFAVLLNYRERWGNVRVPLKYKADLRLGKWVQSQRQEYKKAQEGKDSKLTDHKIQKLTEVGFDWRLEKLEGDNDDRSTASPGPVELSALEGDNEDSITTDNVNDSTTEV